MQHAPDQFKCDHCRKTWTIPGCKGPHMLTNHRNINPSEYIQGFVEIESQMMLRHPDRDSRAVQGGLNCMECDQSRDTWIQLAKHYIRKHKNDERQLVVALVDLQNGRQPTPYSNDTSTNDIPPMSDNNSPQISASAPLDNNSNEILLLRQKVSELTQQNTSLKQYIAHFRQQEERRLNELEEQLRRQRDQFSVNFR